MAASTLNVHRQIFCIILKRDDMRILLKHRYCNLDLKLKIKQKGTKYHDYWLTFGNKEKIIP